MFERIIIIDIIVGGSDRVFWIRKYLSISFRACKCACKFFLKKKKETRFLRLYYKNIHGEQREQTLAFAIFRKQLWSVKACLFTSFLPFLFFFIFLFLFLYIYSDEQKLYKTAVLTLTQPDIKQYGLPIP